jgi:hypothetical protein
MTDPTATADTAEMLSCSLPAKDMLDRLAKWKALAEQSLSRSGEPGRVVSTYPRSSAISTLLRELIEAEADCCPFLSFDVREYGEVIEAELRYPPEFEPIVAMIAPHSTSKYLGRP